MSTLLAAHFRLSIAILPQNDEKEEQMMCVPYASIVRNMMYAMVCTCPDISYAFSIISRYMRNPDKMHWKVVKWIRGTTDVGLIFDKIHNTSDSIIGYIDSDYAGDLDKRRSLIEYIFTFPRSAIR